ncbi:MAG TPA: glycoside hydrolase family 2 TIM barrel-domain containing protein [Opitutaceae bacterium]|nr:glycoside hydrolase family 2 TIM barrel-domain containing protein [Opitutaceae bacterium]
MRVRAFVLLTLALSSFAITRAIATTTETFYLSGRGSDDAQPWDFFCTGGRSSGIWTKISVPSCWEQQGFGTYEYGVESRGSKRMPERLPAPDEQGIYRREFTMPASWRGRKVRIVFGGVMTDAAVKINGQSAGPIHQGAFYQFNYDITDKLHFDGPNQIEVTVSKRSANASVNRAERIGDYWNFGGIFRPVWLEAVPAQFIDRVAIDAHADGTFAANVFLGGDLPSNNEVVVQLKTLNGEAVGAPVAMAVPSGARQVTMHAQIPNPATWTAETPNLYQAEFTLRAGGVVASAHTITQRFGFRTFELRTGDGLYLNGHKITLKGVCRHSFWPETGRTLSSERQREDIRLLKEANMNAVRMSHYPPDPEFLELCDEAGLYVLDELGGWQGCYDTPTGRKLIAEMVARDVNHPSILFWDNGNEGGENAENDDEFAKHDPQKRPVLHPWALSFRGMNTRHYREYAETAKFTDGPDLFMPTEFLHGLFDGGGGAGLDDYWKLMGEKPHAAGGFLWAWMDEAVARTDENGRLDARRDLGPDGIVGPHHEKEGSFFTVREIWSPVQIPLATLPDDFAGAMPVRNRYDFLNLSGITFQWQLMKFAPPGALLFHRTLLSHGRFAGPDLAARTDGTLQVPLPKDWREADALYLTAFDSRRREIWTWSWQWKNDAASIGHAVEIKEPVKVAERGDEVVVTSGRNTARFDKTSGLLAGLERDGRKISLNSGPRLTAYRRVERSFVPVGLNPGRMTKMDTRTEGDNVIVTASYDGAMREVRWTVTPDGDVHLDYTFNGPGSVDILGVDFDYPEEKMKSKEWLGGGPYRVWQNRLKGVSLGRWETTYNDPIPGESWDYPEFKGWFSGWRWMAFTTTEGRFAFLNNGGQPYVGVYSPRDGKNNPVLVLPRLGLGVYQAITGIGTKNSVPSNLGPQGAPQNIAGTVKGSLIIRLLDQP